MFELKPDNSIASNQIKDKRRDFNLRGRSGHWTNIKVQRNWMWQKISHYGKP